MPGTGIESHPQVRQLRPEDIRVAFNPLPSQRVQSKMDYFFLPYQKQRGFTNDQLRSKYMEYEYNDHNVDYLNKVE